MYLTRVDVGLGPLSPDAVKKVKEWFKPTTIETEKYSKEKHGVLSMGSRPMKDKMGLVVSPTTPFPSRPTHTIHGHTLSQH